MNKIGEFPDYDFYPDTLCSSHLHHFKLSESIRQKS